MSIRVGADKIEHIYVGDQKIIRVYNGSYLVFDDSIPWYNVTVSADPPEGGTVKGAGLYKQATNVAFQAIANEGYEFKEWQENGQVINTNAAFFKSIYQDHDFVAKFAESTSRLPSGYTELQYVQSSGTQYIDTSLRITTNLHITGRVGIINKSSATGNRYIYGAYSSSYQFGLYYTYNSTYLKYNTTQASISSVGSFTDFTIDHNLKTRQFKTGNGSNTISKTISVPTSNLFLFSWSASTGVASSTKLWSFDIFDESAGKYVRQFVPCKNPSGVVGLYDLVTQLFFKPGAGTLVAGPVAQ